MKKTGLLYSVLFCCCIYVHAQKIQYSRQTFKLPYVDAIQLVANIKGNHHLVCFNANKAPAIYIFDAQLQLQAQTEVDFKLKENCDIRLIPFTEFYYLYVHPVGTSKHELFKIDDEGNVASLSKAFQQFVERELNKNTSTLQLINQDGRFYVMAYTYYDVIKKMGSTVSELDKELNPVLIRKVLYSFNGEEDILQQATLAGNCLFVLKTSRNDEKGNSLDMIKVDLATGQSLINSFNSGTHLYTNPAFSFNVKDSSILVYSLLREPLNSGRLQRTVFISHLSHSLQEVAPVTLLRSQFRDKTAANYLLLQGSSCWLNMNNYQRVRTNSGIPAAQNFQMEENPSALSITKKPSLSSSYFAEANEATGVRFTVLNEQMKTVKDSLVANDKKVYDVQPRPYAQFTIKDKGYLLLVQNFSSNRRGLLMVNANESGHLTATDIRVFDKYEYRLQQLQTVNNNYVILPYTHKNEIGLVKITPE